MYVTRSMYLALNTLQGYIIESVDSICRDGADTPRPLSIQNGSELPSAAVTSAFRHMKYLVGPDKL